MSKLETIQDLLEATEEKRSNRKIELRGQVRSEIDGDNEFQFHDVYHATL